MWCHILDPPLVESFGEKNHREEKTHQVVDTSFLRPNCKQHIINIRTNNLLQTTLGEAYAFEDTNY